MLNGHKGLLVFYIFAYFYLDSHFVKAAFHILIYNKKTPQIRDSDCLSDTECFTQKEKRNSSSKAETHQTVEKNMSVCSLQTFITFHRLKQISLNSEPLCM